MRSIIFFFTPKGCLHTPEAYFFYNNSKKLALRPSKDVLGCGAVKYLSASVLNNTIKTTVSWNAISKEAFAKTTPLTNQKFLDHLIFRI